MVEGTILAGIPGASATPIGEVPQGQPVEPPVIPEENRIPYPRFQEVVSEKNALKSQLETTNAKLAQMANLVVGGVVQPVAAPVPQFETAEELVAYNQKQINDAIATAKKEIIEPIQQRDQARENNATYSNNMESYFAGNPDAAAIRDAMNTYSAALPENVKQAIKATVIQGDPTMMDMVFGLVAGQGKKQTQNLAGQATQGQANQAMSPPGFRTVRPIGAISRESYIANAKENAPGKPVDMTPIFGKIAQGL